MAEKNAEKKTEKSVEKETPKEVDVNAFIARKLMAINLLDSDAEKQFLAQRVLNNKRGNK